jgi:hypothetical protein
VPIYCELQAIWRFVTPNRIYRVVAQHLNPLPDAPTDARSASPETRRLVDTVIRAGRAVVQRYPWKADFNQCEGSQLIDALRRADARYCHIQPDLPFVLIGHSKTFTRYNAWSLRPFLAFVQANPHRFGFGAFSDINIEAFREPLGAPPPDLPAQQRPP